MSLALENVIKLFVTPLPHKTFRLTCRYVPEFAFINCKKQLLGSSLINSFTVLVLPSQLGHSSCKF